MCQRIGGATSVRWYRTGLPFVTVSLYHAHDRFDRRCDWGVEETRWRAVHQGWPKLRVTDDTLLLGLCDAALQRFLDAIATIDARFGHQRHWNKS